MNDKKGWGIGLLAMLFLSVSGCGSLTHFAAARHPEPTYRTAYIARSRTDAYSAWLAKEMKAAAAEYDDISLEIFDAKADDAIQNRMIEDAVAEGYDAVIVQPNSSETQRPYVEKIVTAGICAVTTNPRIPKISKASSVDVDAYAQGALNAELAVRQIPKNAKVVVLNGIKGHSHSEERRRAWQTEFFEKRPDVQIAGEAHANFSGKEAAAYMKKWTADHPKIDAIISMNDDMALGALEAVSENKQYRKILCYGVDGTPEACKAVKNGRMTATCLQSASDLAEMNLEVTHRLLTGEEKQIESDITAVLITSDNASEYVEMYENTAVS